MPRGPDRQWRARKDPVTDPHVLASVQAGLVDNTRGFYSELFYVGIETEQRAAEIRRSLFRSAKKLGYSLRAQTELMPDGSYRVRFHAIDKAKARAWMIRTYGPDRTKWPYNPRQRAPRSEP